MSSSTAEVVRRYYDCWNRGEVLRMKEVLAEDLLFDGPFEKHKSAASFISACERMASDSKFQNIKVKPKTTVVSGKEAVALYEFESGSGESVPMAEYFRVEGGKIQEIRLFFDGRKLQ